MLPTSSRWISIHKTLTSLDQLPENHIRILEHFNPQGSHESRRAKSIISLLINWFQSTRLSRASTMIILSGIYWLTNFNPQGSHEPRRGYFFAAFRYLLISIHKALTSLDITIGRTWIGKVYFNPQGSHEPRQKEQSIVPMKYGFQSTRLSRAST